VSPCPAQLPPWATHHLEPSACEAEARLLERKADIVDKWATRGTTKSELDRLFNKAANLRLEARIIRGKLD
jgi:hypothetical protein